MTKTSLNVTKPSFFDDNISLFSGWLCQHSGYAFLNRALSLLALLTLVNVEMDVCVTIPIPKADEFNL